jgi:hypothetical protein
VEVYAGTEIEEQLRREGRLVGDYFGYNYRIADPRAQLAYEIFRKVFTPRNFAIDGMNHQAMRLDYYFHILRHFHPNRAGRGLGRQVKRLVAELNRNSAELLGEICRFAATAAACDAGRVARLTRELAAWRADFDEEMGRRMDAALETIHRAARGRRSRGRLMSTAASMAAAALLASAAEAGGTLIDDDASLAPAKESPAAELVLADSPPIDRLPPTHASEMIAVPPPVVDMTLEIQVVPPPKEPEKSAVPRMGAEEAAGVKNRIAKDFGQEMLRLAARRQMRGREATLRLEFNKAGEVAKSEVRVSKPEPGKAAQESAFSDDLGQIGKRWKFPGIKGPGFCELTIKFRPAEEKVKPKPPDWHMFEMAPRGTDETPRAREN